MKKNGLANFPDAKGKRKLLLTMKLTLIFLFACFLQVSATVYSQNTKLSFDVKNKRIEDVLREIEEKSDFRFFYQREQVDVERRVTLDINNKQVEKILDQLFSGQDVTYDIREDNLVLIKAKNSSTVSQSNTATVQQKREIRGKVADTRDQTLPGVTVKVKGTVQGTITNANGEYSLSDIPANAVLSFSFVGMRTQEVVVGSQAVIDIIMTEDAIGLDEVVVVGYGTQKRADLTGAVSSVAGEEVQRRIDLTNTAAAMQGMSPGLMIQNFAGEPGRENVRVRIRGHGTLNNSNPLVLIDGVEQSLATVDPGDIESITVLKDAASASIYGSRAANGVILITTKRGTEAGTVVTYDFNVGFQNVLGYPKATDPVTWLKLENEAAVNAGGTPLHTDEYIQKVANGTDPLKYPFTIYEDYVFRNNSPQQRHSVSLTSGGKFGRIFASVNYLDQAGIIHNFGNKRLSARVNSDLYVSDKLTVNFNLNYRNRLINGPGFTAQRIVQGMLHINRTQVGRYPDGTYDLFAGYWNSVAMMNTGETTLDADEIISQTGIEYKILPTLSLQGDITLKTIGESESNFMESLAGMRNYLTGEPVTVSGWFAVNNLTESSRKTKEWSERAYLNYDENINKHHIQGMIGFEGISNNYRWLTGYRDNFFSNELRDLSSGATSNQRATGGRSQWKLLSFFGRMNYAYDDKYLFQANVRYDGSSRFGEGHRWGLFPSFSAGWRVSEEEFLADNNVISNMRLRASWGKLGNQEIGLYRFLNTYNLNQGYAFNDATVSGAAVTTAGNPVITWETTTMTNIGADFGFLNNRVELVGEYFWNMTNDILLNLPIPPTTGVGAPTQNAAAVSNNGFEISMNYHSPKRAGGGLEYSVGLNFSDVINTIEDLKGTGPYFPDKFTVWEEGYSMNSLRGLESPGIYRSQSDFDKYPATIVPNVKIGDIIYLDKNGDGVITQSLYPTGDQIVMGNEDPRYEFGINASATYHSFDFSMFIQGVMRQYHGLDGALMEGPNWQNFIPDIMARETYHPQRNPEGTWPLVTSGNSWNLQQSTFWIQDTKYLRLKNIQLGYTFKPKAYISSMRVYVSGENLLTVTPTELFDPETPRGRSQFFPHTKIVSAGLNIKF